jgi:hypothetical protein
MSFVKLFNMCVLTVGGVRPPPAALELLGKRHRLFWRAQPSKETLLTPSENLPPTLPDTPVTQTHDAPIVIPAAYAILRLFRCCSLAAAIRDKSEELAFTLCSSTTLRAV